MAGCACLDGFEEVVVRLPLVLEGEPAVGHVVEILQPLEVGDGYTASVDVHVGDDEHALVLTVKNEILEDDFKCRRCNVLCPYYA